MVGTTPPLTLKVLIDPKKPRTVKSDGTARFTIGAIELYCGDKLIKDPFEKKLAWFFMMFGGWTEEEPIAEVIDGKIVSYKISTSQELSGPLEKFAILGSLSEMISRQYNLLTAPEGKIEKLTPSIDTNALGIIIPPKYKGKVVRLWRFTVIPNYE